ncbi:trimeric intracellular cation channel family protein [Magnetospirillum molischianum]|uniref:Glycine transporter domain-containing protein n=1 Tax=Magnetospirillum molischianum DSM 120 TaxID=1150626 RepID=H8FWZ2_MAGML|nr:trimeric intracellular cation channel family protein [Magnetospirillum molischianum]CCG42880.1 conserved membrane hypothetical protein [Magnetospirillum molischianum DSM 120]
MTDAETVRAALHLVELLGVAVFAVSGALMAAEKRMDPFGFAVLGTATAIGGGTLRDLVIGVRPVFWVGQPDYLIVSVVVSIAMFWLARLVGPLHRALLWSDALGMALFTATGTQKALAAGVPEAVAVAMGVITAAFGGILRDVLAGDKPMMFHNEVYATAAFFGASAQVVLYSCGVSSVVSAWLAFLLTFAVRGSALRFGWRVPSYGDVPRIRRKK